MEQEEKVKYVVFQPPYQLKDNVKNRFSQFFGLADAFWHSQSKLLLNRYVLEKNTEKLRIPLPLIFHTILSALRLLCDTVALWVLPLIFSVAVNIMLAHVRLIISYSVVHCDYFQFCSAWKQVCCNKSSCKQLHSLHIWGNLAAKYSAVKEYLTSRGISNKVSALVQIYF